MPNYDYENLLARYFAGEASAEERAALERWRKAALENERTFAAYEKVWNDLGVETAPRMPKLDQAWLELESKLGLPQSQPRGRILEMKQAAPRANPAHVFAWRGRSGMLAVAAVLMLALGALFYKSWQRAPAWQTVATANAEQRKVELADGSLVTLNSGSTLEFPQAFFGATRELKLAGEAFFEVAHDSAHPFIVQTPNAQIKVLGTKFGIWSRDQETRVVVRQGRVALRGKEQEGAGVELTANQMSVLRKQEAPEKARRVEAQYALGWLEGRIVFDQTSLAEVLAELQRVYNVELALAKPALAQNTITGSFNRKPVESVLASICLTLNLHYRQEGGRYIISE